MSQEQILTVNTEYVNNGDRDHRIMDTLNANEVQIGGKHYQSKYQHWDFVLDMGLDYFEGCATKYITRRKNNRKEDLEKAKHFLIKKKEIGHEVTRIFTEERKTFLELFCLENRLSHREYLVLRCIFERRYDESIGHIEFMLAERSF